MASSKSFLQENLSAKENPILHYLWMGPPTKDNPNAVAGHDVVGPIMVAVQLEKQKRAGGPFNKIKFFCFDQYCSYYQELFKTEGVHIEVISVEQMLEDNMASEDLYEEAAYVKATLDQTDKNETVSLVQFKDLFSLFLLNAVSGYIMDTNVQLYLYEHLIKPEESSHPGVYFEYMKEEDVAAVRSPDSEFRGDFYLLYSPKRCHDNAIRIFNEWTEQPGFGRINVLTRIPIFDLLYHSLYHKELLNPRGLHKISYKSYKNYLWLKGLYIVIPREVRKGDFEQQVFEERLRFGNINEQKTCNFSVIDNPSILIRNIAGGTITHHCILQGKDKALFVLLKNKADVSLKADYSFTDKTNNETFTFSVNALELATLLNIRQLLSNKIKDVLSQYDFNIERTNAFEPHTLDKAASSTAASSSLTPIAANSSSHDNSGITQISDMPSSLFSLPRQQPIADEHIPNEATPLITNTREQEQSTYCMGCQIL